MVLTRRKLLQRLSGVPLIGALTTMPFTALPTPKTAVKRDLFRELGITPVINASVTMTYLLGSLMMPGVMEAINVTAQDFANMYEL